MITIHKYLLPPGLRHEVTMPEDAEILSAHEQHNNICIWALVTDTNRIETRVFQVVPTGGHIESTLPLDFIDTVHLEGGRFVFHVFEVKT